MYRYGKMSFPGFRSASPRAVFLAEDWRVVAAKPIGIDNVCVSNLKSSAKERVSRRGGLGVPRRLLSQAVTFGLRLYYLSAF